MEIRKYMVKLDKKTKEIRIYGAKSVRAKQRVQSKKWMKDLLT